MDMDVESPFARQEISERAKKGCFSQPALTGCCWSTIFSQMHSAPFQSPYTVNINKTDANTDLTTINRYMPLGITENHCK